MSDNPYEPPKTPGSKTWTTGKYVLVGCLVSAALFVAFFITCTALITLG